MISSAEFIAVSIAVVFLLYAYAKWSQSYWARKRIPHIAPTSIWGLLENPLNVKRGLQLSIKSAYDELRRRGYKYGGIYLITRPVFVAVDTDLIKRILAKDFSYFIGHAFTFNEAKDPLLGHLFNMEGDRWRNMRIKLSPTFTSGKMKMMFQTLVDCGDPMISYINKLCKNNESLDIKEILACYTTDVIGSCAFGLECNSFVHPDAEFRTYGRKLFTPSFKFQIQGILDMVFPLFNKHISLKLIPMEIETFFINAIKNILDYRTLKNVKRNDFVQLFLEMQKNAKANGESTLSLNEIAAQAFVFFLAGFETSSTTMTFCLHELAFDQDIQDKLRNEIRETMKENDGKLSYESVMEMKYLDQVVNETLRKYPPVPFLNRVCNMEYKVPGTDDTLDVGTSVFISSLGLHRDEEYYPNPEKFDPERFTEENKATRPSFTFLPFGEGPRICIGLRFGVMQTKTGLSMLLNNYRITPAKNETYDIPFDPFAFILTKKGKIMLNAEQL